MSNTELVANTPHSSGFFVSKEHEPMLRSIGETATEYIDAVPISLAAKRALEDFREGQNNAFDIYRSLSSEYVDLIGRKISQDLLDVPTSLDLARRLRTVRHEFGAMDDLIEKSNLARDKEHRLKKATSQLLLHCMDYNPYNSYKIGWITYSFDRSPMPQVVFSASSTEEGFNGMSCASTVAFLEQPTILPEGTRYATGLECAELVFSLTVQLESK